MKKISSILASLSFSVYVFSQGQIFYVSTGPSNGIYNMSLYKLNITTCDTTYVGLTDSISLDDIAITPDNKLYGISGNNLYQVDTSNAHLTLISHLIFSANALVADSSGNLLAATDFSNDSLYQINRFNGQSFSLGCICYASGGDLTFYHDTLYLASVNLIQIILHPTFSTHIIGPLNVPHIFGINTICINNIETMIATGGQATNPSYSNLYQVNPANANLTILCDTILHQLILGAASIYDINGEAGCSISSQINRPVVNNEVEIFPNPFTASSTLQFNTNLKDAEVVIYDMVGKEMMRRKFIGDRMEIEKGNLESGVYFVMVRSGERQWVEKLVVE